MWQINPNNVREIPISSPDYPAAWKSFSDAPDILYAVGDISLIRERKFVVVGSRRASAPALKLGEKICEELSSSLVIVTGTADGGDSAAIEGALQGSGKVICLLAGGFSSLPQGNINLMEKVAKRGLLLSPYPFDTPVRKFSYEYRNKLLAALGEGVLVLGAAEKSGALITARYAWRMKKLVFALPYFPGSASGAGCNAILKAGGIFTETAFDVAQKLGIKLEEKKAAVVLTLDEEKMLESIRELGESHITELAKKSGVSAFKAKAVLSALEVKGFAVSLGGNRYSVI